MRPSFFVQCCLLLPLVICVVFTTSCQSSSGSRVTEAPIKTQSSFVVESPISKEDSVRKPTATTDYLAEIERITKPLALLQTQARMKKLLEFSRGEPRNFFKQLRRERPVYMVEGGALLTKKVPNIYLVSTYSLVKEVLDRHTEFAVNYKAIMDPTVGAQFMLGHENTGANAEKPLVRATVDGINNVPRIRETIAVLAKRAIQKSGAGGKIDVVQSVSRAVPLALNQEYFGFDAPIEDLARWSRTTQHAFFHNSDRDDKVNERSLKSGVEMRDFIRGSLIPSRKTELANGRPPMDSVSLVLDAPFSQFHSNLGLSDERIVSNIIGFIVGSVETTSTSIAQTLNFILSNPPILKKAVEAALADDNELMSRIVWEASRFDPINPFVARIVTADTVIGKGSPQETRIEKGAVVLASTESAMFDEALFQSPDQFRLDRDPSKYMHLGGDYHRCLGDNVALIMVPETIKQLLKLKNIKKVSAIDQKNGPFPESFVVTHDSVIVENTAARKFATSQEVAEGLELISLTDTVGDSGTKIEKQKLEAGKKAIQNLNGKLATIWYGNSIAKSNMADEIEKLATSALSQVPANQQMKICFGRNSKVQALFPVEKERSAFCSLPTDFRACWSSQRFLLGRPAYSAYYHCSYGQNYLNESERSIVQKGLAMHEDFYFLKFEGGRP